MRLHYFQGNGTSKNFGDELNPLLWTKFLPHLDQRGDTDWLFLGIGTLLNERLPEVGQIVVFGSGVGYGNVHPRVHPNWKVYFLRGPRSATILNLPSDLALTDPALLVASLPSEPCSQTYRFSFMPHWQSASPWLEALCLDTGINYIDPGQPVSRVLHEIRRSRCLLAEAMHGVIVADALRIPWVPLRSAKHILEFKWLDWCESVGLSYDPHQLLSLWPPANDRLLGGLRDWGKRSLIARQLRRLTRQATPRLSSDDTWQRLQSRLHEKVEEFKRDYPVR